MNGVLQETPSSFLRRLTPTLWCCGVYLHVYDEVNRVMRFSILFYFFSRKYRRRLYRRERFLNYKLFLFFFNTITLEMCGIYKILRWSAWATVQRKIKYEIICSALSGDCPSTTLCQFQQPKRYRYGCCHLPRP